MGSNITLWKEMKEEKFYKKAYVEVDDFFESLYRYCYSDDYGVGKIDFANLGYKLVYREGQNCYSLDVMEIIKEKAIGLFQAGVGIGKSWGYLIPIFMTYNNVPTFKKIVISTSSIALQEQLIKDIKIVSKMLDIDIKVDIAKGINNYACLSKIYYQINRYMTTEDEKQLLKNLVAQMEKVKSSDKLDLIPVSEAVWEKIQLQSRGYCSKCSYIRICPFMKRQATLGDNNILVTNHANMARNILDSSELLKDVDMVVFDEAHKLLENIQGIRLNGLKLEKILKKIDDIGRAITLRYQDNTIVSAKKEKYDLSGFILQLKIDIEKLFSSIRTSASKNFTMMKKKTGNYEDYAITDVSRLVFKFTPSVMDNLNKVVIGLKRFIREIDLYEYNSGIKLTLREITEIKKIYQILVDMALQADSKNIYWVDFYEKNKIILNYIPKNNFDIIKDLFSRNIPILCTSGTMLDSQKSYHYFSEELGVSQLVNRKIYHGEEQLSPYDYDNNTLLYYNPSLASPHAGENYIMDLALEIDELIRATEGKALILFTSKKTMNSVYKLLSLENYPFELLLHTDNNTSAIKKHFAKEVNSCLFATGAFWEGIDIKGKSLSNLIITHLPFDQVDAISQYKASKFVKNEQFNEVYFPSMLRKFQQAVGRLIRSDSDVGIVCCLDSRFANYKDVMIDNIQIKNCTTNKEELYQFVADKILKSGNNKGYRKEK